MMGADDRPGTPHQESRRSGRTTNLAKPGQTVETAPERFAPQLDESSHAAWLAACEASFEAVHHWRSIARTILCFLDKTGFLDKIAGPSAPRDSDQASEVHEPLLDSWIVESLQAVRAAREQTDRVAKGLSIVIDRSIPLLCEADEHRVAARLAEAEDKDAVWAAIEYMLQEEGTTRATATLAATSLVALYPTNKDRASALLRSLLRSGSVEDIDMAIRVIDDIADESFRPDLMALRERSGLPAWLRETLDDAIDGLDGDP